MSTLDSTDLPVVIFCVKKREVPAGMEVAHINISHPRFRYVKLERAKKAEWRATARVRPYYDTPLPYHYHVILVMAYPCGRPFDAHKSRFGMTRVYTALFVYYLIFSTGIFDTVQRSLGLATSNCTIEMASVGQRTIHSPQRMHFSSSMIISAPPCQLSVPRCIGSPLTTRESPSILMQS